MKQILLLLLMISVWGFDITKDPRFLIHQVYETLKETQPEKSQQDSFFPPQFAVQKDLYKTSVKLNFMDSTNGEIPFLLRKYLNIPDDNMFVTNFVVMALLETHELGMINLDKKALIRALDAINTFKDKNYDSDLPAYNFWPQTKLNEKWIVKPSNLYKVFTNPPDVPSFLDPLLKRIGLSIVKLLKYFKVWYKIPADADDSGCNMALTGYLNLLKDQIPDIYNHWKKTTPSNYKKYYQLLKKYAYRPFANETGAPTSDANITDPRTYFYIRGFLQKKRDEAKRNGVPPKLILANTWLTNVNDQIIGYSMIPYFSNNVDLTVNANSLFGLTFMLLTLPNEQADDLFDDELKKMYQDITDLLVWAIEEYKLQRPDLALLYYPSTADFYWFISRLVHRLNSFGSLPYKELERTRDLLTKSLRISATQTILKEMKKDSAGNYYWVEFLGDYAKKERSEDRLFSTAVTCNALLDTWTITANGTRRWVKDVPATVVSILQNALNYLGKNILSNSNQRMCAFFSGDIKTEATLPGIYPATINKTMDAGMGDKTLYMGVEGLISEDKYQKMIKEQNTPTTFRGYNAAGETYPYWSSDALSYAVTLNSVSKFHSAQSSKL